MSLSITTTTPICPGAPMRPPALSRAVADSSVACCLAVRLERDTDDDDVTILNKKELEIIEKYPHYIDFSVLARLQEHIKERSIVGERLYEHPDSPPKYQFEQVRDDYDVINTCINHLMNTLTAEEYELYKYWYQVDFAKLQDYYDNCVPRNNEHLGVEDHLNYHEFSDDGYPEDYDKDDDGQFEQDETDEPEETDETFECHLDIPPSRVAAGYD